MAIVAAFRTIPERLRRERIDGRVEMDAGISPSLGRATGGALAAGNGIVGVGEDVDVDILEATAEGVSAYTASDSVDADACLYDAAPAAGTPWAAAAFGARACSFR